MLGGPAITIGLMAVTLWVVLWLIARHDADFDWHKMRIVTAITAVGTALLPLLVGLVLFENLNLNPDRWWWLLVVLSLVLQIGFFVLMLHKYLWVPVHKALAVWLIVQVVGAAKEYIFFREPGESFPTFACRTVTGRNLHAGEDDQLNPELAKAVEDLDTNFAAPEEPASAATGTESAVVTDEEEGTDEEEVPKTTPMPPVDPSPKRPTVKPPTLPARTATKAAASASAPVPSAPASASVPADDPGWDEARKLLVFKGRAEAGGTVRVFINNEVVEVGKTIRVTHDGRPYRFKLVAAEGECPEWLPAP